jgi:hypothetical protein
MLLPETLHKASINNAHRLAANLLKIYFRHFGHPSLILSIRNPGPSVFRRPRLSFSFPVFAAGVCPRNLLRLYFRFDPVVQFPA